MAKAGVVTAILAAVLVMAGAVVWATTPPSPSTVVPRGVDSTQATVYAVIGEWEGRVAVFFVDSDTPKTVYDTAVRTLPETEQQKLKNGIPVFSAKELAERLEDYAE